MKLVRVKIQGFGKLRNLTLEFSPGFNLIWGPNEAGKSTLQQALLAALYGFYSGNRATTAEKQRHWRFKPWSGDAFALSLRYALADGRTYDVFRDFSNDDLPTKILDAVTGEDVTRKFSVRRHGNLSFAREHLGMPREIFEATAFVRQAEVKALQNQGGLVNEMVSLLDSGGTKASAEEAIAFLEAQIARVGTDRARVQRLPVAQKRLRDLQSEQEALLRDREAVRQAAQEKQQLEKALRKDRTRLLQYRYLILGKKIEEIEHAFQRSSDLRKELETLTLRLEEFKSAGQISEALRDGIVRKFQTLENQREQIEEIREEIARQKELIGQLDTELKNYTEMKKLADFLSYETFSQYRTRWELAEETFRKSKNWVEQEEKRLGWEEGRKEHLRRMHALLPEAVQDIREQESRIATLEDRIKEMAWEAGNLKKQVPFSVPWKIGLALLGALGVGLTVLSAVGIFPAWGKGGGAGLIFLAAVLLGIFLKKQRSHEREVADFQAEIDSLERERDDQKGAYRTALAPLGVQNWQELLEQRSQFEQYTRKLDDLNRARGDLEAVEFQLLKYLDAIGIREISKEVLDSVAAQFRSYFELAKQRETQQQILEGKQKELARVQDRMELTCESLSERLQEVGIEEKNLEKARALFTDLLGKRRQYDQLFREIEKRKSELTGLFSGKSEAELRTQQEELSRKRDALLGNHPELKGTTSGWSAQKLQNEYEQLDRRRQEMEKQVERLETQIRVILTKHRPQAEIEEELAQAEEEVRQLLRVRRALEKARDTLTDVMKTFHRNLAPLLNQEVSRDIARVTGGRYREVRVDPRNFSVSLSVPETGEVQNSELVSLGTQEQVYFLLRVAIARLLSENSEPLPLLLDDPFVHFDGQRLENVLQLLKSLARETQILVFTKDEAILKWTQKALPEAERAIFTMGD